MTKKKEEVPEEIGRTFKQDGAVRTLVLLTKVKGRGNRPLLVLTEDGEKYIEKLFAMNCSTEEVAADLGICVETLHNRYNEPILVRAREKGHNRFKTEIRQQQRNILKRGDSRMAIWLGKQYLGQTDRVEATVAVEQKGPDDLTWDEVVELLQRRRK